MNANPRRCLEARPTLNAHDRESLNELVRKVIGAVYEVANSLGVGFLEKVYERALLVELRRRGLNAEAQVPIRVWYKNETVGDYYADILVEGKLMVELKCAHVLCSEHMAQILNHLKASNQRIALLVNFQHPKVEWKRVVYNF